MAMLADLVELVIGVDTHNDTHTATVVVTGAVVEQATVAATPVGYRQLLRLADRQDGRRGWAIESPGGYGAGLTRFLATHDERVVELDRPSGPPAATAPSPTPGCDQGRQALAATGSPSPGPPASGRHGRRGWPQGARRSRPPPTPNANSTLAHRSQLLNAEIAEHTPAITTLGRAWRPELRTRCGVGPIVAAIVRCAWSPTGRCRTGARSFAAIAEWATDAPQPVRAALGARRDAPDHWAVPAETTIRRTLGRLDANALAAAVGAWLADRQHHDRATGDGAAHAQRPQPRQRAVAVDGKMLRGARAPDGDGRPVHLLAAMDHTSRAILAQRQVGGAPEEVPGFRPLLANSTSPERLSPPRRSTPTPTPPSSWSPTSRPTTCSRSRPTSPPCWPTANACPGTASRSPIAPATRRTAASSTAPSSSSPSTTSASPTPPRSCRSPASAPSASRIPAPGAGVGRP